MTRNPITRILCPVDFSEASQHAIKHAIAIARWYKASITGHGTNRRHRSSRTSRRARLPHWLNFGATCRRVRSSGSDRSCPRKTRVVQ
jgi:nucleotide-binding universal stress UspA family protein